MVWIKPTERKMGSKAGTEGPAFTTGSVVKGGSGERGGQEPEA